MFIYKIERRFKYGDLTGELLLDAKMGGFPGDPFPLPDQSGSAVGNGFFTGLGGRNEVQIDAAGQIEADLGRGVDFRYEQDFGYTFGVGWAK